MNAPFLTACVLAATSGAAAALHRESDWYWWFELQRWAAFLGAYGMFLWHKRRKHRNHFTMIIFVLVLWGVLQTLAYLAITRYTGGAHAPPTNQPTRFFPLGEPPIWRLPFFAQKKPDRA